MDNLQRVSSRDTLERLFWAGVEASRHSPDQDARAEIAGRDVPVEASGAAAHEPNPGRSEPAPAQEPQRAWVDSPAVQPVLIDASVAHPAPAAPQAADPEASLYAKKRGEITDLMNTLRGSVVNIEEHGRRAESIVKNMLSQLRESAAANQAFTALNEERLRA